jgi:hypothetical protein
MERERNIDIRTERKKKLIQERQKRGFFCLQAICFITIILSLRMINIFRWYFIIFLKWPYETIPV